MDCLWSSYISVSNSLVILPFPSCFSSLGSQLDGALTIPPTTWAASWEKLAVYPGHGCHGRGGQDLWGLHQRRAMWAHGWFPSRFDGTVTESWICGRSVVTEHGVHATYMEYGCHYVPYVLHEAELNTCFFAHRCLLWKRYNQKSIIWHSTCKLNIQSWTSHAPRFGHWPITPVDQQVLHGENLQLKLKRAFWTLVICLSLL